jgi:hypothetical protein
MAVLRSTLNNAVLRGFVTAEIEKKREVSDATVRVG